ncbi:MAG: DMT family transporter [Deltaproteobacteria bacterium]|nr:DMT family transporter [Deltaproteobacteria bacterium]
MAPRWTKRKRLVGVLQLAGGAAMISFSAVFVKLAHVGPTMAGFYRVLFGGIILAVMVRARGEKLIHEKGYLLAGLLSAAFFALDLSLWHRSITYVGPGLATLLANFQVFFLAALGILVFKEIPSWRLLASIPLAMIGLYLIVGVTWDQLGEGYKLGVLLGLITALCYTAYILTLRKTRSLTTNASSLSTIALVSLLAALIMGLEALVQGESFAIPDLQSWSALLAYGVVSQVLGWVLISAGLLKVAASQVGLVLLLQPTLAFLWDILFFSRPTVFVEILGAALALLAIYLGTTARKV